MYHYDAYMRKTIKFLSIIDTLTAFIFSVPQVADVEAVNKITALTFAASAVVGPAFVSVDLLDFLQGSLGRVRALFKFAFSSLAFVVTVDHATFTRFVIFPRLRHGNDCQKGKTHQETERHRFHLKVFE